MEPFEDNLRRTLGQPLEEPVDTDALLAEVHHGARRRRRRRALASSAAAVTLVAAGGYAVTTAGLVDADHDRPAATDSADATTSTDVSSPLLTTTQGPPTTASAPPDVSRLRPDRALSFTATGSRHQWVLMSATGAGCPSQGCALVSETEDAGESWRPLAGLDVRPVVDPAEGPVDGAVTDVRFSGTGEDGWVYGGALRSTHDGGRTWREPEIPVSGNVELLEATSTYAFAVVADHSTLIRSPVAEDRWQPVDTGIANQSVRELVVSTGLVAVRSAAATAQRSEVFVSADQGQTWQRRPAVCPAESWATQLSPTKDALWVLCQSADGRVLPRVSTDAGLTWLPAAPPSEAWWTAAAEDAPMVLAAIDPDRAMLWGTSVAPGVRVRAGETDPESGGWVTEPLGPVRMAGFTNSETGYVLDITGRMLRTRDGESWSTYPLPE